MTVDKSRNFITAFASTKLAPSDFVVGQLIFLPDFPPDKENTVTELELILSGRRLRERVIFVWSVLLDD